MLAGDRNLLPRPSMGPTHAGARVVDPGRVRSRYSGVEYLLNSIILLPLKELMTRAKVGRVLVLVSAL